MTTSKFFHDEQTKLVVISVVVNYAEGTPTRKDCEDAIDHLLSSIPGAADSNGKDGSMKSAILAAVRGAVVKKDGV